MDEKRLRSKVRAANRGWPAAVKKKNWQLDYDSGADMLYGSFGPPQEAYSLELENYPSVYLRLRLESNEIVGFDILTLKKGFLRRNKRAAEVFQPIFDSLGEGDWFVRTGPGSKAKGALRSFLFELLTQSAPDLVAA